MAKKELTAWDKLSMSEKALFMKLGLLHGLSDLKDIRDTYNFYSSGGNLAHTKSGEELGERLYLKLDDAANYKAYEDATNYFLNLGFGSELASKYAIDRVHNNMTFDAGMLPEINVTAQAWGNGDNTSRMENYLKARLNAREALTLAQQIDFNLSIRDTTDKWGKPIGLGITALAALPMISSAAAATSNFMAAHPILRSAVDTYFAIDGIKNATSDNGILKTYNLAKLGDTYGAIKSGIGDALDLLGFADIFNMGVKGYKYFKNKPNLGTMLWDALPESTQLPTKRAVELLLRLGSGPVNDIPLWLKQFSTDPEFHKYIFTGQRPSNRTLGLLSTGNSYSGYLGYFASDRVDEAHDLISAYLYGNKLDPSIAKHISTGLVDDFGALRPYITSNYADKMSLIPVYDTGIGYLNGMWDPNPVPYQAYITQLGSIPYPYNQPNDFYTADMRGKIDVGGHTIQQGVWHLDDDIPVFRGLDIWKFNPKDYMKKWSNPDQPFSVGQKLLYKTGVEFLDAMGTPFVTRTNWTIDPRVPLPNDFDRQKHRFIVNHLEQSENIKSTGGPLYPFSFEKNPFLKTPIVRYDEGGHLFGFGDWLLNLFNTNKSLQLKLLVEDQTWQSLPDTIITTPKTNLNADISSIANTVTPGIHTDMLTTRGGFNTFNKFNIGDNDIYAVDKENKLFIPLDKKLYIDNMRPRLDYIGGDKDLTRKQAIEVFGLWPSIVDVANLYLLSPDLLARRLSKEGFLDTYTDRYNQYSNKELQKTMQNNPQLFWDSEVNSYHDFGLDTVLLDYIDGNISILDLNVKEFYDDLIKNNKYTQGSNEKGDAALNFNGSVLQLFHLQAAYFKYLESIYNARRKLGLYENIDLDTFLNAAYNLGIYNDDLQNAEWVNKNYKVPSWYTK